MKQPSFLKKLFDSTARIKKVRLDASTACQLKCLVCDTASGKMKDTVVGCGFLKFSNFKKFIDNHPQIKEIELSNCGELFLNPEIVDIIRYGKEQGLELSAGNGSNFNDITDEALEALVKYKFDYLSISLDGASQETYVQYRVGGDFDKVINNIKKLNEYKKKYNSPFPELGWQFIVFGHNEHELPKARKMAKELGMEFKPKLNCSKEYSPIKNIEFVKKELGGQSISREEHEIRRGYAFAVACLQLWHQPQINFDGTLLGCCINFRSGFGNVFEDGLEKCLKSEKYVYAKKMLQKKVPARADIPCIKCSKYHKIANLQTGRLKKEYLQKERAKLNTK